MKLFKKSALFLVVTLGSGLKFSNPALAQYQYPNSMQEYQRQCAQNIQYACIQLEQMYRRNDSLRRDQIRMNDRFYRDQQDINRMNRQSNCRNFNYSLDDSHCDEIK